MPSNVSMCLQGNLHKARVTPNSFHLSLCSKDRDLTVISFLAAIIRVIRPLPQLTTQASFLRHRLPTRTKGYDNTYVS